MELDTSAIATLITSVGSVAAIVIPVIRSNQAVQRHLKSQDASILVLGRDMKRLIVHDDKCTIEERINAGKEYVDMGGNGSTEVYLRTLMQKYKEACEDRDAS